MTSMIRASSFPLAVLCAASTDKPGVQVDTFDPTATAGQDIHRAIAIRLEGGETPNLPYDVERLVDLAVTWCKEWLFPTYPGLTWRHNEELRAAPVSGTLDLNGRHEERKVAVLVDFKGTYRDDDHTAQMMAYAWLLFCLCDWLEQVVVIVPKLRLGVADTAPDGNPFIYSRKWVTDWMKEFSKNTLAHPEIFRPGEWCSRCKRKFECPALRTYNRETVDVLADPKFEGHLVRQIIPSMRPRVKLLEESIKLYKGFEREAVLDGGPIDLGTGKKLVLAEENHRQVIPHKAWALLQTKFTDEEMESFLEIGVTKLEEAISAKAPKGKKAAIVRTFMDDLKTAGAVGSHTVKKIKEVTISKELPQ